MQLVDTCIKNGGDHFLAEIASKEFVDEMSGVIKSTVSPLLSQQGSQAEHVSFRQITNPEVKEMALRYFQQWALAFESKKELSFFVEVYNELKNSGAWHVASPSHVAYVSQ